MSQGMPDSKRILVVDDEPVVLEAVSKALRKLDCLLDTVESAEEALKLVRINSYDLVITDLMMPAIDGLGLMKRIREMGCHVQVVMITGYPTVQTALRAKRLGAMEYVTKPFTRQELVSVVVRALRRAAELPGEGPRAESARDTADKYFIPDHSWARIEPDGKARIGMARTFASAVGRIRELRLPAKDAWLDQGRMCVVILAEDGVEHSLHAPLSGRVIEINPLVAGDARLAGRDAEGSGWLLRLDPQDAQRELQDLIR